ncbi:hypothetical protein LJB85_02970 [Porphyromonadaceae bacterium OttesenSCG-928-L07]|nr:hypothetical protein [Porphyromonadaceae bacterium OttesenSCG-928-L07]MDL2251956.1 hypothetical protein [Odoribacter sp. OttesenSCG-928-J03]MDL2283288.1 hypothetical protein [Odoribacter sp. OttesenSCG-928-G04]
MKRILILLLVCVPVLVFGQKRKVKQANQDTDNWRYEIEMVSEGVNKSVVTKVWSYSTSVAVAMEQAKKNAVHAAIFKGIPGKESVNGKRPLVKGGDADENSDFFKSFFANGGDYMRYVTLTNSGALDSGDSMKVSKKEYRVGVYVSINYNELRNYLQDKGIIKKLGSGF